MRTSFVAVPGSNVPLFVAIDRPDGLAAAGDVGVRRGIVFCHGLGSYRTGPHDLFVQLSAEAVAAGYTCARFDFSGHGDSLDLSYLQPGQHSFAAVLANMVQEARAVKEYFVQHEGIDQLVTVGICSGAMTSLVSLLQSSEDVETGAVLLAIPPLNLLSVRQILRQLWASAWIYIRKAAMPKTWARLLHGDIDVKTIARAMFGLEQARKGAKADVKDAPAVPQRDCAPVGSGIADMPARDRGWLPKAGTKRRNGDILLVTPSIEASPRILGDYRRFFRESGLNGVIEVVESVDHNFSTPQAAARVVETVGTWLRNLALPAAPPVAGLGRTPARALRREGLSVPQGERLGSRRVWARLHPAEGESRFPNATAVIVPPFFHERNSAYSSLVCLRKILLASGYHVATFDPGGMGESQGFDRLPNWRDHSDDLAMVGEWARGWTGASTVAYIGLRLGATLAVVTAARQERVGRVVALEPIVSGRRHVHELTAASRFSGPRPNGASPADGIQVSTFKVGHSLLAELTEVDLAAMTIPSRLELSYWRLSWLAAAKRDYQRLARHFRDQRAVGFHDRPVRPFWNRIGEQAEYPLLQAIAADLPSHDPVGGFQRHVR